MTVIDTRRAFIALRMHNKIGKSFRQGDLESRIALFLREGILTDTGMIPNIDPRTYPITPVERMVLGSLMRPRKAA